MDNNLRDGQEFAGMPEQVYQGLLWKSRQVSAETALSVDEHREIVRNQRSDRGRIVDVDGVLMKLAP